MPGRNKGRKKETHSEGSRRMAPRGVGLGMGMGMGRAIYRHMPCITQRGWLHMVAVIFLRRWNWMEWG